ncbi:hypothetical protein [Allochromatium vinosum]|uniref:hypothetical protein n=1 Tax=Allochromatium vinosum TaxID=1049 RepID=UPI0019032AF1|nr:hypothetical protein [Allochromatium vinosum]MBK1655227.1 hypothetical protein [Allochromatium vinosum]
MTAAELLPALQSAGLSLFVTEHGALRYRGDPSAVARWLPEIRAHKPALVELLTRPANDEPTPPPLATASRAEVEAWMDAAGETDPKIRREILTGYGFDPDFQYPDSGRRTCRQCANLEADGGCRAARRGQIPNASRHYTWPGGIDALHRCIGYRPGLDDHITNRSQS